jgi:hypothetical protein
MLSGGRDCRDDASAGLHAQRQVGGPDLPQEVQRLRHQSRPFDSQLYLLHGLLQPVNHSHSGTNLVRRQWLIGFFLKD